MTFFKKALLGSAVTAAMGLASMAATADVLDELMKDSKVYANLNLRYESVEDDRGDDDALTLRSWIGFKSGSYNGFSTQIEFEDVRPVLGNNEIQGFIADPNEALTELDQAFVQYKNETVTAKLGRQVITLDNHRYVGHVAWRQDKQTFDAARVQYKPMKDLMLDLSYVYKVNRINSPAFPDQKVSNILVNASYKTPVGKVVGYYYDLSEDRPAPAAPWYDATTTLGGYLAGSYGDDVKVLYKVELATQDNDSRDLDTDYHLFELGVSASGITAKASQETVGSGVSSDGMTRENFSTPLSTIHAFNGWADIFLGGGLFGGIDGGNGLVDTYFTLKGKVAGVALTGVFHDYESDNDSRDLGSEFNLLAVKKFGKKYTAGFKYADYSAGDFSPAAIGDREVVWAWLNVKL